GLAGGARRFDTPRLVELLHARFGTEIAARYQRHALLERKVLRPIPDQQHVRALIHHQPCELDRVLHMPYRGHRAGVRTTAIHDRSIELGSAVLIEYRATPGIELRVILHALHRGDRRIEARTTAFEYLVAGIECRRKTRTVGGFALRCHL